MSDTAAPPGWDDILDNDEDLIWQGNPVPGIHAPGKTLFLSVFGLPFLFAGLACFAFGLLAVFGVGDSLPVLGGVFVMLFGLPFAAVGLRLVIGEWYIALTAHRHVHYTLSTRRAYIATDFWKRSLDSYPIETGTPIRLEDGTRGSSVWFATRSTRGRRGRGGETPVGFENIADGTRVYRLMRDIQQEHTR